MLSNRNLSNRSHNCGNVVVQHFPADFLSGQPTIRILRDFRFLYTLISLIFLKLGDSDRILPESDESRRYLQHLVALVPLSKVAIDDAFKAL